MATKPAHNLITDGITVCADYVLSVLKRKKVQCDVFVDRHGGLRVRTSRHYACVDAQPRPDVEFVCSYTVSTACVEYIREDLAYRRNQLPMRAVAA